MTTQSTTIPSPVDDDDEDVHWALSTSSALWARGEHAEALKWLRRAAETASDANADSRALELFKAAADVASKMDAAKASAPPPAAHAPPAAAPQPAHAAAPRPPVPVRAPPAAPSEPSNMPFELAPRAPAPAAAPAPPHRPPVPVARPVIPPPAATTPHPPPAATTPHPPPAATTPHPPPAATTSHPPARPSRPAAAMVHSAADEALTPTPPIPAERRSVPATRPGLGDDLPPLPRMGRLAQPRLPASDVETVRRPAARITSQTPTERPPPGSRSVPGAPPSTPGSGALGREWHGGLRGIGREAPPDPSKSRAPALVSAPRASSRGQRVDEEVTVQREISQIGLHFDDLDEETSVLSGEGADELLGPPPEVALAGTIASEEATDDGTPPAADDASTATAAPAPIKEDLSQTRPDPRDHAERAERSRKSDRELERGAVPAPQASSTGLRAAATIPALRVAIVAGSDGEPRVIALRPGTEAPQGAVAAMLVAMTREDGETVLRMLGEAP